jgi:hypothetical protein
MFVVMEEKPFVECQLHKKNQLEVGETMDKHSLVAKPSSVRKAGKRR